MERNQLQQSLHSGYLTKRIFQGAGIAFVLIVIFLFVFFRGANLEFGLWTILPLFTVPAGGAVGGIFYYLMDYVRYKGGWKKKLADISSLLVYIVLLWLSLVAAFAVTGLWD